MKHQSKQKKSGFHIPKPWEKRSDGIFHFKWKILTGWLLLAGVSIWVSTAGALYWFIKYNSGYSEVRFSHVIGLPMTLKAYRQAKGEFFLHQGLDAAKDNRWRDAFDLLQSGLPANPENEEARMTLARIYLMARRPDQATIVFLEGLDYRSENQADYIRTVLTFLFEQQADDTVVEISNSLLSRNDLSPDVRDTILAARVYANFNRDRFEEAQKSLLGTSLENSLQAKLIAIRIAWERGLNETALVSLRDLYGTYPQNDEIYRTLAFYLREQGLQDEARRLALSRQIDFPTKPEPYLDFIRLCSDEQMKERRTASIDDYLRIFGRDSSALLRLQALAAQQGWSEVTWKIVSIFPQDTPREQKAATALALEADFVRKAYDEAGKKAAELLVKQNTLTEGERMIFTGLEGLAYLGRGVEAEGVARFNRVLSSGMVSSAAFTSLGKHVQSLGKIELAERLFTRAIEIDALNTTALISLLQLKLDTHKLDESLDLVERLPLVRKPSRQLIQDILNTLRSDSFLYVANRDSAIRTLEARVRLIDQR